MTDNTIEMLEELPWGPGTIKLLKPLEVDVSTTDSGTVLINADKLRHWGEGDTYADALIDFASTLEIVWDELNDSRFLTPFARETLAALREYVPEDLDDEDW